MLCIHEETCGDGEATGEGPAIVHDIEDVEFYILGVVAEVMAVGCDCAVDTLEGPAVDVEFTVENDLVIKDFTQWFSEMSEDVLVPRKLITRLEVTNLV
jgi:hypothetical protein